MLSVWAETNGILADEFRGGNASAGVGLDSKLPENGGLVPASH
jgi:hypothetical protein